MVLEPESPTAYMAPFSTQHHIALVLGSGRHRERLQLFLRLRAHLSAEVEFSMNNLLVLDSPPGSSEVDNPVWDRPVHRNYSHTGVLLQNPVFSLSPRWKGKQMGGRKAPEPSSPPSLIRSLCVPVPHSVSPVFH